jgi:hypothetical protein
METREIEETIEESPNKKIALIIAILALFLAISETLSKSYQTEVLMKQIEASNLWSFYQAKSIRLTTTKIAHEAFEIVTTDLSKEGSALRKKWADEIQRYESDEATKEGKREILERARLAEEERDLFSKKYRLMEIAAGLLQVAIVLASASIITGVIALIWASGGLGIISLGFIVSGMFFPTIL